MVVLITCATNVYCFFGLLLAFEIKGNSATTAFGFAGFVEILTPLFVYGPWYERNHLKSTGPHYYSGYSPLWNTKLLEIRHSTLTQNHLLESKIPNAVSRSLIPTYLDKRQADWKPFGSLLYPNITSRQSEDAFTSIPTKSASLADSANYCDQNLKLQSYRIKNRAGQSRSVSSCSWNKSWYPRLL
jgi:hypothetical protein